MSEDSKVFSLHYIGNRFHNARLPVDVLSDLPAFRELLVAFAKDEWRNRHADRKRIPKGFDKSLAFDLVRIEDGSAIPMLEWSRNSAQINLPGFVDEIEDILESAHSDLVQLFNEESRSGYYLSTEKIRALNRFGAGLRENERIEITDRKRSNIVFLDAYRRKRLITGARETYSKRIEGSGELIGIYIYTRSFGKIVIRINGYGDVDIPLNPVQIKEEFEGNLNQHVQFDVTLELDRNDRPKGVESVFDIFVIDEELTAGIARCRDRLRELRALSYGWHDGAGSAISEAALRTVEELLEKRPANCNKYRLYPTEAGGVLLDFEHGGWDYSIEFNSNGEIEMYGIEIDGGEELEPQSFFGISIDFLAFFDSKVGSDV